MIEEYLDDMFEYEIVTVEEEQPKPPVMQPPKAPKSRKSSNRSVHTCFCGQSFPSQVRYSNHYKIKHTNVPDEEMLHCMMCGKKFKIQSYLEMHIRNVHTDNPMKHRQRVACSICGQILKSLTALKNHEEKHTLDLMPEKDVKKFQCDLCGMKFRMKSYVFNHINNAHLRTKYSCEYCQKGFYKRYELSEHVIRFHTHERPFICEYENCGKTFARQKNYAIHKVSLILIF